MPIQYDSNGIITQNLTEILEERESNLKNALGEEFVIDKTTPIGNMELADANNELAIQELIAWLIPNMIDANTATGYFLDCICEKNRIYRKQPQYTTLNLVIHGAPRTSLKINDLTVQDNINDIYYNLDEDCTLDDEGLANVRFKCEYFGDFYPSNNSKFDILTPINGVDKVDIDEKHLDLKVGRYAETDNELRRRRMQSVQQNSTTTLESMKSNMYSLDGVMHAYYFENDTEKTNLDGLPMKSFEFVIDGGSSKDIANVLFLNKPAGTRAYGTTNVVIDDSQGVPHNIGYTKAEIVNIGMDIKLKTTLPQSTLWKDTVKKSLKEKFNEIQDIGTEVKDYNYYTVLTTYPEISDIEYIKFFDADALEKQYYTQYPIKKKQIAKLDVKDITITIG